MKSVLADTSYYVAFLAPNDQCHELALEWSGRLLGRIVVTEYVLIELGNMLSGIKDRHLFVPFVDELLRDQSIDYIPSSPSLLRQGFDLFDARSDKEWSLVDCISFVVMRESAA